MTKLEALEKMEKQHRRFTAAIAALPDGADIIHASLCSDSDGYVQLWSEGELPDGPFATEYYEDGTPECSTNLCGVKVLWIGEKEVVEE